MGALPVQSDPLHICNLSVECSFASCYDEIVSTSVYASDLKGKGKICASNGKS